MKQLVLMSKQEYEGLQHYGVIGMKWGVRKEPETKGGKKGGSSSSKGTEKRRSMRDRAAAASPYVKRLLVGGLLAYAGYKLGFSKATKNAKDANDKKSKAEALIRRNNELADSKRQQMMRMNVYDKARRGQISMDEVYNQISDMEAYAKGDSRYGDNWDAQWLLKDDIAEYEKKGWL